MSAPPRTFLDQIPDLAITVDDERALAAALGPEQWVAIQAAEHGIESVTNMSREGSFTSQELDGLADTIAFAREASLVLEELGGLADFSDRIEAAFEGLPDQLGGPTV